METEPTIHSLYDFVRDMREEHGKLFEEVKGKQDVTNVKLESLESWRSQHEKDDKKTHQRLHDRISQQRNIAGIFGSVGFVGGFVAAIISQGDKVFHWFRGVQ